MGRKTSDADPRAEPYKRQLIEAPNKKKKWSQEDDNFLQDKWGTMSIPGLAKRLGRSKNVIIIRGQRLGLGAHLASDERISYHQLINTLYGFKDKSSGGYEQRRLMKYGIPVKWHRVLNNRFRVISMDDFWKWAEDHKDILNFKRFEPLSLGPEPAWVKDKRKIDVDVMLKTKRNHNTPWTSAEDAKLQRMVDKGTYTYTDIAVELRKTEGAVKRRIYDAGITGKPKRYENRSWTDDEVEVLLQMKDEGYDWMHIGCELGRSALGVRGKFERLMNPEYMKRYYRGKHSSKHQYTGIRDISTDQIRENLKLTRDLQLEDAPPR